MLSMLLDWMDQKTLFRWGTSFAMETYSHLRNSYAWWEGTLSVCVVDKMKIFPVELKRVKILTMWTRSIWFVMMRILSTVWWNRSSKWVKDRGIRRRNDSFHIWKRVITVEFLMIEFSFWYMCHPIYLKIRICMFGWEQSSKPLCWRCSQRNGLFSLR